MADAPIERIVLLGASNLSRSFAFALAHLREQTRGPLDVLATPWPGRSFGLSTRVLGRELPSIVECGVWRALAARPSLPTKAVILDAGNDLAYGVDPATVASWISICAERIAVLGARGVLVRPPLRSLESLGVIRFRIAKALLFPGRPMELRRIVENARSLDAALVEIATRHAWALVEPPLEWFGLDPIHWKRASRAVAWRRICAEFDSRSASPGRCVRARRPRFESERLFGRERSAAQPSGAQSDGTLVSWF